MHTVIVGGGFAGVKAALELAKRKTGKVTLISNKPYFLYHAALYATVTGSSPHETVISLEDIFSEYHSVDVVEDTIVSLDPARNMVVGKATSYAYDTLVLAIGSETSYLNIPGMKNRSYGMKTLEEISAFHKHLKTEMIKDHHLDKNYVIVGGGPTGVELAGVIAPYIARIAKEHMVHKTKVHVTLVEASDRLLPTLSATASRKAQQRLEALGVKVLVDTKVRSFNKTHITLDDKKIPTKTVVWTAGAKNNTFFEEHPEYFQLAKNRRVVVNPYLEAYRDIYVLGDNANVKGSGTAPAALAMGAFLADHLIRKSRNAPLKAYRPKKPAVMVPIGEKWAYAERWGIYMDGYLGHVARRRFELNAYRQILPEVQAQAAWNAHNSKN
ncbi:MAG: NAD(P)/FAD-dependent oxidoreductase [Candidatus Saccharimonadales bacterium]